MWTPQGIPADSQCEKGLRESFLLGLIAELRMAGQAGECLQSLEGLFLHSDEKTSFLLSTEPIPHKGDVGGKTFMG